VFRNADRPRVAALLAFLGLLGAIGLGVIGLMVGKASVDEPSNTKLERATGETTDAERELRTLKIVLESRTSKLEASEARWRARAMRAEQALERWRARARRAERRVRVRAAARRAGRARCPPRPAAP
jgi:hypothetical protein